MFVLDDDPEEKPTLNGPDVPGNPCVGQIWLFIEGNQFEFRVWTGKEWTKIHER